MPCTQPGAILVQLRVPHCWTIISLQSCGYSLVVVGRILEQGRLLTLCLDFGRRVVDPPERHYGGPFRHLLPSRRNHDRSWLRAREHLPKCGSAQLFDFSILHYTLACALRATCAGERRKNLAVHSGLWTRSCRTVRRTQQRVRLSLDINNL